MRLRWHCPVFARALAVRVRVCGARLACGCARAVGAARARGGSPMAAVKGGRGRAPIFRAIFRFRFSLALLKNESGLTDRT